MSKRLEQIYKKGLEQLEGFYQRKEESLRHTEEYITPYVFAHKKEGKLKLKLASKSGE